MKAIEFFGRQKYLKALNGEVSIDQPHQRADEKEQNQNLDGVVKKEVDGGAQMRIRLQRQQLIRDPIHQGLQIVVERHQQR